MVKSEWIRSAEERIKDFKELQKEGLISLDGDFYSAVHYPGITMYPPINDEQLFTGYSNPQDNLFTIYAYIPFCIRYCTFCHYPVKIGDLLEEKDYYLSILESNGYLYETAES